MSIRLQSVCFQAIPARNLNKSEPFAIGRLRLMCHHSKRSQADLNALAVYNYLRIPLPSRYKMRVMVIHVLQTGLANSHIDRADTANKIPQDLATPRCDQVPAETIC